PDGPHVGLREADAAGLRPALRSGGAQGASMGAMPRVTRGALTVADVARALADHTPRDLDVPGFRRAAVLVPLVEEPSGLSLLLTVRAPNLRSHAGQVALPGGRLEPGEDDVAAALREAAEEVGIAVPREEVIGELSDHPSPAGYVARPVVARVPWPQPLRPDPDEVAERSEERRGANEGPGRRARSRGKHS